MMLCVQLLGHLLQVVKRVADNEKLEEGYRVGKRTDHNNIITVKPPIVDPPR